MISLMRPVAAALLARAPSFGRDSPLRKAIEIACQRETRGLSRSPLLTQQCHRIGPGRC